MTAAKDFQFDIITGRLQYRLYAIYSQQQSKFGIGVANNKWNYILSHKIKGRKFDYSSCQHFTDSAVLTANRGCKSLTSPLKSNHLAHLRVSTAHLHRYVAVVPDCQRSPVATDDAETRSCSLTIELYIVTSRDHVCI